MAEEILPSEQDEIDAQKEKEKKQKEKKKQKDVVLTSDDSPVDVKSKEAPLPPNSIQNIIKAKHVVGEPTKLDTWFEKTAGKIRYPFNEDAQFWNTDPAVTAPDEINHWLVDGDVIPVLNADIHKFAVANPSAIKQVDWSEPENTFARGVIENIPTVEDMLKATGDGFQQEGNLTEFLNEWDFGVDASGKNKVTFNEAIGGVDAVEVRVGNQEEGEGTVFDWKKWFGSDTSMSKELQNTRKEEVMNDILMHAKIHSDQTLHDNFFKYIDDFYADNEDGGNVVFQENNSGGQAKFFDYTDKKILKLGGRPSWMDEEEAQRYGVSENGDLTYDGEVVPNEQSIYQTSEKTATEGRLFLKGKGGLGTLLRSDASNADGTGYLILPEEMGGGKISYTQLFNYRSNSRDSKREVSNDLNLQHFINKNGDKGEYIDEEGIKRLDVTNTLDNEVKMAHQAVPMWDQEILTLKKEIKEIESGQYQDENGAFKVSETDKENLLVDSQLTEKQKRLQEIIINKGYQNWWDPTTLEPVHGYTKGEWTPITDDDGEPTGMVINSESGVTMPDYMFGDDSEAAEIIAHNTKEEVGHKLVEKKAAFMTAIQEVVNNMDVVEGEQKTLIKAFGEAFDKSNDSWSKTKLQLQKALETGDIHNLQIDLDWVNPKYGGEDQTNPFLGEIYSDSEIAKNYNQARKEYITFLRAYTMNVNLREMNEESFGVETINKFRSKLFKGALSSTYSEDDAYDIMTNEFENDGFILPDHMYDESTSYMKRRNGKRQFWDGATEMGAEMFPLVASIYMGNKATGFGKLSNLFLNPKSGLLSKGLKTLNKSRAMKFADKITRGYASPTASWIAKSTMAGALTVGEWATHEKVFGEGIFGWESHTLHTDKETGRTKLNASFPFWMGFSGNTFGMFQKHMGGKILQSKRYGPMYGHMKGRLPEIMNTRLIGNAPYKGLKTFGEGVGHGATGTILLTAAEGARMLMDPVEVGTRKAKERKEEWKNLLAPDHLAQTFMVMKALAWGGVPFKARKLYEADVLSLSKNPGKRERESLSTLDIDNVKDGRIGDIKNPDGSYKRSAINKASRKKQNELTKEENQLKEELKQKELEFNKMSPSSKKYSAELKGEKLTEIEALKNQITEISGKRKKINNAKEIVELFNDRIITRTQAEHSKKLGEWFQEQYINNGTMSRFQTGNWNEKDVENIMHLDGWQQADLMYKAGIEPGTPMGRYYKHVFDVVTGSANNLKGADVNLSSTPAKTYMKNMLEGNLNTYKIEELKGQSKKDPAKKVENDILIKELKEKNKVLAEDIKTEFGKLKKEYETILEGEIAQAKIDAKELGIKFDANVEGIYLKKIKNLLNQGKISEAQYKNASKAEGLIIGDQILVNKKAALRSRNMGVAVHEITHRILKDVLKHDVVNYKGKQYSKNKLKQLKKDNKSLHDKIVKGGKKDRVISRDGKKIVDHFLTRLNEKERAIVEKRMEEEYKYDDNGKKKHWSEYYEEYITTFGDAIKNKEIERNRTTGRKLAGWLYPQLRKMGIGANWYKFDINGKKSDRSVGDLYDMVQEIQSKGVTKEILDFYKSTGGRKTVESTHFSKSKESFKDYLAKLEADFLPHTLNKNGTKKYKTKEEWQMSEDFAQVFNKVTNSPRFDRMIQRGMTEKGIPEGDVMRDFTAKVKDRLMEKMLEFDPVKNESFLGWLIGKNPIIEYAKGDIKKEYLKEQKGKKTSLDKEFGDGFTIADLTAAPKDIRQTILENEVITYGKDVAIRRSKLRRDLKLDSKMMDKVRQAVVKTFGTRLPDVNSKEFKKVLEKAFETELKKSIQDMMGTKENYNKFLLEHFESVYDALPVEKLVQMERNLKPEQRIFTTSERITKPIEVDRLISDGLLPKDVNRTSGPQLHTKNKFPGNKKILSFFRGIDIVKELGYEVSGSTLGTRKDAVAKNMAKELGFDATMEVLNMPEVMKKRSDILKLDGKERLENEIAIIAKQINREPSVMFSKSKGNKEHIELLLKDIFRNGNFQDIIIKGPDGKNILIESYGGKNISQASIDKVASIWESAKIIDSKSEGFKKLIEREPRKWADNLKQILLAEGTFDKYNTDLIKQVQKDLPNLFKKGRIPKEIMNLPGFWDMLGFHTRVMDSAKLKSSTGKPGKHYDFKQKLIKQAEKLPDNPKVKEWVENAELMNKKFSLFKDVEKILNKNISKSDKLELLKELEPRITKAGEANIEIHKHIIEKLIDGVKTGEVSQSTFVHLLQAQTNLVGGFRALTRLDLMDVRDFSQGLYKYKNKKGEWQFTNDSALSKKNNGKINEKHPDLRDATIFYGSREKAIEKLRIKGEHVGPSANTNVKLVELMVDAVNGKHKSKSSLNNALDAILEGHSQLLTNEYITDIIDKGGKNNPTNFHRVKFLDTYASGKNYVDNIVSANGKGYYEVLAGKELTKWERDTKEKSIENKRKVDREAKINLNVLHYSKSGEKVGASIFDFDDTLAKTKSGIRTRIPNLDGLPKPGKKVIFLAGGAGSGKGNVVSKLNLEKQGFKIVNQDISLEWLKKNHGLPENMKDLTKEQRSTLGKLGHQARGIAKRKMMKFQGKGDGVVIDGTGGSMKVMEKLVAEFKDKGYDTSMLFVETSLETALSRNKARKERSLLDVIVKKNHEAVQLNKHGFKDMFGEQFMEVKTDKLKQEDAMPSKLVEKMNDFVSGYERLRLDATEFAKRGEEILSRGGEFDFSEFNKVVEGTEGPYLQEAIKKAKKYGTKDMFVLTARPQESARAIHEFLKSMGLDIPIENITGLANSTGEAKAKWMLDKFSEGYNDMYFVDDAFANVKAVKDVLNQLDIKSTVVQAKAQFSKSMSKDFNEILERRSGFEAGKKISLSEAKIIGKGKGRFDFFIPPSAEDFKGLMYKFLGKGKQGDADMRFFKKSLFDPFAKGTRDLTMVKQKMVEEYETLRKESKDVKKILNKEVGKTPYTTDAAIRMYLWEKAGFNIPDISNSHKRQLIDHVKNNPKLKAFAESLSSISRLKEGYVEPSEYWMLESIGSDLNQITKGNMRKKLLAEWIENKNTIFSKENLNKIEAMHGPNYREALENILYRMETGTNRIHGVKDGPTKRMMDWINGSVGATMFWNTRSAMLQTISTVNFINWKDNNVFAASKAFANLPQFFKDFKFIFNSQMLKQRRGGLEIDVSASELTNRFEKSGKNPKAILKYLLEKGFTPTRYADSFAIAMGGSTFYRNRLGKYIKEGMSKAKAKEQAWLDFQEIAEETQQSSRPDLISQQQAGPLGRIILAWQNTPMQMTRLMKKAASDLVNRRGDWKSNVSRILYYGAMQNLWFATLQSGLGWLMFGTDQEEAIKKKEIQVVNSAFDTLLRGTGIYGAVVSTLKNTALQYKAQRQKKYGQKDMGKVAIEMINLSPVIGSKVRKTYNAINTWEYNKGVGAEMGLRVDNPNLHATANVIEAWTNIPTARVMNKANNLEEAITGNHEVHQRLAMALGWNRWNVGAKDEDLQEARQKVKEKKKEEKKEIKNQQKIDQKKKEEDDKKKQGIKPVRCSGIKSSGQRCNIMVETKAKSAKCVYHKSYDPTKGSDRDNDGIKEYQCKATTSSGNRCKNRTENKNKKCYAHQ